MLLSCEQAQILSTFNARYLLAENTLLCLLNVLFKLSSNSQAALYQRAYAEGTKTGDCEHGRCPLS